MGVVTPVAWRGAGDVSRVSGMRCGPWQTVAPRVSLSVTVVPVAAVRRPNVCSARESSACVGASLYT